MKLLKTTLAVVAASAISSAVLADGTNTVIYQSGVARTPAALTYNGTTINEGGSMMQDITGTAAHTSVFAASPGMNITAMKVPCTLNNGAFSTTQSMNNQMYLTYSTVSVVENNADVVSYTLPAPSELTQCNSTSGTLIVDGTDMKYATLELTGSADEVSYTVLAAGHTPVANEPVSGTYRGDVTITTTAE